MNLCGRLGMQMVIAAGAVSCLTSQSIARMAESARGVTCEHHAPFPACSPAADEPSTILNDPQRDSTPRGVHSLAGRSRRSAWRSVFDPRPASAASNGTTQASRDARLEVDRADCILVALDRVLHRLGQIAQQIKTVSNLDRVECAPSRPFGISASAIMADEFDRKLGRTHPRRPRSAPAAPPESWRARRGHPIARRGFGVFGPSPEPLAIPLRELEKDGAKPCSSSATMRPRPRCRAGQAAFVVCVKYSYGKRRSTRTLSSSPVDRSKSKCS